LETDFPKAQIGLNNVVMNFSTVLEPDGRGARSFYCLFTAYDLEIFSALSTRPFYFIATALIMVLEQWGLG
jgi:hypothetical protein